MRKTTLSLHVREAACCCMVIPLLAFLPSCASQPHVDITGSPLKVAFACPAEGTKTTTIVEGRTKPIVAVWHGSIPTNSMICRQTVGEKAYDLIAGFLSIPTDSPPGDVTMAFIGVFSGDGKSYCYDPSNKKYTFNGMPLSWHTCLKQVGTASIEIEGTVHSVLVIQRDEEGTLSNYSLTKDRLYLDIDSNVWVAYSPKVIRGDFEPSWIRTVGS